MPSPVLGFPARLAGRFRVGSLLGQGGLAKVVRAVDERTGSTVALKVLHPNLRADEAIVDRFRREVAVVSRVRHPHVIRIDGLHEDGPWLFLAMELHEGGDLADRLALGGPMPLDELRTLAAQVGGALEAAHRVGVVHRDLKPQNVLVGSGALDVRLADFGLARTADSGALGARTTALGTPESMAPEVIADGQVDPRSDLYSFGVLLFEAATGRLPFQADGPYALLRRHVADPPPRARAFRPDLPEEMDDAIARALEKEPLDRFPDAGAMVAGFLGRAPPAVPRGAAPDAPRARCQRCGGEMAAAAICLDCGATGLALAHVPRGASIIVTGPGALTSKLDGRSHIALVQLLEELPAGTAAPDRLRKPPRLPVLVATDLDDDSAVALRDRLQDSGFVARIEPHHLLGPREIRRKVVKLAGRVGWVAVGMVGALGPIASALSLWVYLAIPLGVAGAFVWSARRHGRPLALPGQSAVPMDAARVLAAAVGRLDRRGDRRLVARLLERGGLVARLAGPDIVAPLLERAGHAAAGLAAADEEARQTEIVAAAEAGGAAALDRLREAERRRAALLAELLRILGRLDDAAVRLARAEALAARAEDHAIEAEIAELALDVDAEVDVQALLAGETPARPGGRAP